MKYRSIYISDFHLGTKYCKSAELLNFLENNESDYLYLVGDILDNWNFGKKEWYFNDTQQKVVDNIIKRNTKVFLINGNHDEVNLPNLINVFKGKFGILEEVIHYTANSKKLLVIHGHQFDTKMFIILSDFKISLAMKINKWHYEHKSKIAGWIVKHMSIRQHEFYKNIEKTLNGDYDGIVCGHIHIPKIEKLNNLMYYNCGDWVKNCTALVETYEGEINLI
jgi:UDP-2,3-diacylglucosamine pyrophosphatase LpxH